MFGSDILFAPIMESGQTERQVYLPAGRWIRTTDSTLYEGNQTVTVHAELEDFIAFVPENSEIITVFTV